jgi:hypothetical protein
VVFRDPPSLEARSRALQEAVAAVMVRAPRLPVSLPVQGLKLLEVRADRKGIELVLGFEAPVAALRFERVKELVSLGSGAPGSAPVRASVRALHDATARRLERELSTLSERVRASLTPARWDDAWSRARDLAELPIGVPMGFYRQLVAGIDRPEALVRTGFLCNQDCGICWQDRTWGRFDADQIVTWIEDLHAAGARSLILSGGEPTLDASLERYVRHARAVGYLHVALETNAVQLAKPGLAARFKEAGVTSAFVSLHSARAEVSDAITRAPGTHARTVKGVKALFEAGVPVKLNAVMTQEGIAHLSELPDFIDREFGAWRALLIGVMLSYPTQPWDTSLIPRIAPDPVVLRRELRRTIDRALALGITPDGLEGPCGPPLCAFGADPRVVTLAPVPEAVDFRTYLPGCDGCAVRDACLGVRTTDAQLYGDLCIEPLRARP